MERSLCFSIKATLGERCASLESFAHLNTTEDCFSRNFNDEFFEIITKFTNKFRLTTSTIFSTVLKQEKDTTNNFK